MLKNDDGKYPAYAWPGGYPIYYVLEDGEVLCPACMNNENGSIAYTGESPDSINNPGWHVVGNDVNYEDESMFCAHCNKQIEAAYGEA